MSDYRPEVGDRVNMPGLVTEVSESGDIVSVALSGAQTVTAQSRLLIPVDLIKDRPGTESYYRLRGGVCDG